MTVTSGVVQAASSGVSQTAKASEEITENINEIDRVAKLTAEGATQTQSAGNELSALAEKLRKTVGQFKIA